MKKKNSFRQKWQLKNGDNVEIIAGSNKTETGVIKTVLRKTNQVIVTGINVKVRHIKPKRQGETGRIIKFENPIHISNVKKIFK